MPENYKSGNALSLQKYQQNKHMAGKMSLLCRKSDSSKISSSRVGQFLDEDFYVTQGGDQPCE